MGPPCGYLVGYTIAFEITEVSSSWTPLQAQMLPGLAPFAMLLYVH
jgi:hypothetical protein